jgi:hypothetical protein
VRELKSVRSIRKKALTRAVRDFRRCSLKWDIQGFKPGMTESKASPRLFSRCSKRVERVRTGSTEELGQTIGVFLAASLTDHMCMPSGRCKSVLILWTVGLFDCHSLTFYFWVDIERTRPRRPSGSVDLYVIRWARRKFKRLRRETKGAKTHNTSNE